MPIRLSGMASGLDTDTLVKDLMKSYSTRKDNIVKQQTKLEWKQDAWKEMNSKIYGFYSSSLSKMRFSSAYSLKSASISNSNLAKVSASSTAVSGTQTLIVKELASSGYLTGGQIKAKSGADALTGSSKLADIEGFDMGDGSGKVNLTVNGENKSIEISKDTTINEFVGALKGAGVDANFDEKNGRIFVSAKTSGADGDFSLTANDSAGLKALKGLKLYTVNDTDKAEYEKWANMTDADITAAKQALYEANKYTSESLLKTYTDKYNSANSAIESLNKSNEALEKKIETLTAERDNDVLTDDDRAKIDEEIAKQRKQIDDNNKAIEENQKIVDEMKAYVPVDGDSDFVKSAKATALEAKVDELNAGVKADADADIDSRVAMAKTVVAGSDASSGDAVRTVGKDSVIELNGATFTSNTNNYEINGLTIQVMEKSTGTTPATITTGTDVDGIYNQIKDFFKSYNELIISMDKAFNAESSGKYEPLTDDEKEAMSDKEIEKWETKIKDALLRRDDTLSSVTNIMKSSMLKSYNINGKTYSLASFGIATLGYFGAAENEKGAYHIDGDADDKDTAGNADKLKAAIANDPEAVTSFFTKLTEGLYDGLTKKMAGTSMSSAYTVYNDKKMKSDYEDYKTKISDWEKRIESMEESYYKKFSAMETALSKLQSSTSSMTSFFG